jgi:hypothetical protein
MPNQFVAAVVCLLLEKGARQKPVALIQTVPCHLVYRMQHLQAWYAVSRSARKRQINTDNFCHGRFTNWLNLN